MFGVDAVQCCVCSLSAAFGSCRLVDLSDRLLSPRGVQCLVVARYMPSLKGAGFRGGPSD